MDEIDCLNVKDWIQIGGFLIAAQLTIIALIWQARPTRGIFIITLLLMISFTFFVNSIFSNSKVHHLINKVKNEQDDNQKKDLKKHIDRVVNFGYTTFNIAYTFTLIGFTILAYRYMIDFIGEIPAILLLPVIFIVLTWMLLITYTVAKSPGRVLKELFEWRKIITILLEFTCLIVIVLDYLGVIKII
ncbi:MAG: hypothetical protein ACFFEN_00490 [Candidatus Thorarchaeota archaeon]